MNQPVAPQLSTEREPECEGSVRVPLQQFPQLDGQGNRTPAYASVVPQEDLGLYIVTFLKTFKGLIRCAFSTAFHPLKAIR